MDVIGDVPARLDKSGEMATKLGIDPPSSDLSCENQIRNAIGFGIFGGHRSGCPEWVTAGMPVVPRFRGNRDFHPG